MIFFTFLLFITKISSLWLSNITLMAILSALSTRDSKCAWLDRVSTSEIINNYQSFIIIMIYEVDSKWVGDLVRDSNELAKAGTATPEAQNQLKHFALSLRLVFSGIPHQRERLYCVSFLPSRILPCLCPWNWYLLLFLINLI